MLLPAPSLAQVSEPSRTIAPLPPLKVGAHGLLHREGCGVPIVDELLSDPINLEPRSVQSALETINTRAYPDQPDPMIRAKTRYDSHELELCLGTNMTKAQFDNPDPFGVRRSLRHLSTTLTEQNFDQPDPNRLRRTTA
jgi:hypothetical protein